MTIANTSAVSEPITPLLRVRGLSRDYRLPREHLFAPAPVRHAVREVDLDVFDGDAIAVIGESGSGKSTLVRTMLALDEASAGTVEFDGRPVEPGSAASLHWFRSRTGIVFQDPYSSLDPRQSVGRIVSEPLRALGTAGDHRALVHEALEQVGLHTRRARQYPHELSGGQRQRIAIARAIVHRPRLLVGDEALSALDVTIRAQILELLRRLRAELGLTIVFVSHDIGLVGHLCNRIAVMRDGRVVEVGDTDAVLEDPQHPYTAALLRAVPTLIERTI
jgi:ABC-type glutathione transport system ATPase component